MGIINVDTGITKALINQRGANLNGIRLRNENNSLIVTNSLTTNRGTEQERGNDLITIFNRTARTTTTDSASLENLNHRGVYAILNVTSASGTGGLILRFCFNEIATFFNNPPPAITTTGLFVYAVYPGITAAGSIVQATSLMLPTHWFIRINHLDSTPYTYDVSIQTIV